MRRNLVWSDEDRSGTLCERLRLSRVNQSKNEQSRDVVKNRTRDLIRRHRISQLSVLMLFRSSLAIFSLQAYVLCTYPPFPVIIHSTSVAKYVSLGLTNQMSCQCSKVIPLINHVSEQITR
ncbi:hypothetical protein ID866_7961 [Astraeus odoratus]|nr:hypothetical protein ID866_7961 [Astraeus odoratus]